MSNKRRFLLFLLVVALAITSVAVSAWTWGPYVSPLDRSGHCKLLMAPSSATLGVDNTYTVWFRGGHANMRLRFTDPSGQNQVLVPVTNIRQDRYGQFWMADFSLSDPTTGKARIEPGTYELGCRGPRGTVVAPYYWITVEPPY